MDSTARDRLRQLARRFPAPLVAKESDLRRALADAVAPHVGGGRISPMWAKRHMGDDGWVFPYQAAKARLRSVLEADEAARLAAWIPEHVNKYIVHKASLDDKPSLAGVLLFLEVCADEARSASEGAFLDYQHEINRILRDHGVPDTLAMREGLFTEERPWWRSPAWWVKLLLPALVGALMGAVASWAVKDCPECPQCPAPTAAAGEPTTAAQPRPTEPPGPPSVAPAVPPPFAAPSPDVSQRPPQRPPSPDVRPVP